MFQTAWAQGAGLSGPDGFSLRDNVWWHLPEAYERLLLDVLAGDATLFMRRDAVEVSWTWITDILHAWEQGHSRFLPEYAAGSWGPLEADRLIEAEGRAWRML